MSDKVTLVDPPAEVPMSLDEFCDYIVEHASRIYVRVQIDGRYENRSLAELPGPLAIEKALGFVKRNVMPVRIKAEGES